MPLYTTMRGHTQGKRGGGGKREKRKKRGGGQGEERGVGIDEHHAGQIKEARRGERWGGLAQNQAKRKV